MEAIEFHSYQPSHWLQPACVQIPAPPGPVVSPGSYLTWLSFTCLTCNMGMII